MQTFHITTDGELNHIEGIKVVQSVEVEEISANTFKQSFWEEQAPYNKLKNKCSMQWQSEVGITFKDLKTKSSF